MLHSQLSDQSDEANERGERVASEPRTRLASRAHRLDAARSCTSRPWWPLPWLVARGEPPGSARHSRGERNKRATSHEPRCPSLCALGIRVGYTRWVCRVCVGCVRWVCTLGVPVRWV